MICIKKFPKIYFFQGFNFSGGPDETILEFWKSTTYVYCLLQKKPDVHYNTLYKNGGTYRKVHTRLDKIGIYFPATVSTFLHWAFLCLYMKIMFANCKIKLVWDIWVPCTNKSCPVLYK